MSKDIMDTLPEEMKKKIEAMPSQQRDQMIERLSAMTQQQRNMMMKKMKDMTPEEKEALRNQRESMTPEELAAMSKNEEKQRLMQQKMAAMQKSGKGAKPKAANFSRSLKRLLHYLARMRGKLILVLSCAVFATLLSVLAPLILARALDVFQDHVVNAASFNYRRIGFLTLLLGGVYFTNMLLTLVQNRTMTEITQGTIFQMRREMDEKLMRLPFNYFDSNQKGDILSRVTNDIDNIGTSLQQTVTQVVTYLLTIVGCLLFMLILSWKLTFICLVMLAFGMMASRRIMAKSQGQFREQWKSLGELNATAEEMFSGMNVVKAFGCEEKKIAEFEALNEELYGVSRKAQYLSGIVNPMSNFFNNLAYIAICGIGAYYYIGGAMTLGSISAMIQYQKQYSNPVTQMASLLNTLQSAVASAERVFALLDESEEQETATHYQKLSKVEGAVDFSHLKFGYTPEKILMNDIDVHIKPGQMVAIVGPTGAGKTTLVNLLMRFYEPSGGVISIDGMNIRDMTRHDLRDIFGMVLQDTWLYSGTIYENIAYGNEKATREQVLAAAKSAQIEFFFETMPDGYETMIDEDATNLSQGQKQLMTIARAMVADPKILILDEATSSVDTRTELLIQKAMNRLLEGRTSFVIAHRLSTIKDADLILYMENGNILEQGTHKSLMDKGGKYAELYNSQFAVQEEFHGLIYHDFSSGMSERWKTLLETFGKERGIPVRYEAGDLMGYEKSLAAHMEEDNPPALMKMRFGMLQKFGFLQDMCESLDDLKSAGDSLNKMNTALSHDGRLVGLPYNVEGIGILYNKALMGRYFALNNRASIVNAMGEVDGQEKLIALVEDVYSHRKELGIQGVFPACAFAPNAEDQWKTHMMAMPIYYEMQDQGVRSFSKPELTYGENLRKLYDMFFQNAAAKPESFGEATIEGSVKAFMRGEVPMILYLHVIHRSYVRKNNLVTEADLKGVVREDDIGILPVYFGHKAEKQQNVAVGTVWVHAVNRDAKDEQKQYAKAFLDWMVYSDTGRRMMREMSYLLPYGSVRREDVPQEPMDLVIYDRMHNPALDQLNFAYTVMPMGPFRSTFASDLLAYAKGELAWETVCGNLKEGWAKAEQVNEKNVRGMFMQ